MTTDIVTLLQLDKVPSSKVIVVKEINQCDSSFVTSCVLSHCIKHKTAVIVLSTHNSLQHYHNVGLKMNSNIQRNVDAGVLEFVNLGEYCVNKLLVNEPLPQLFDIVKEKILLKHQKYDNVNVIVDGLSHLFNLNYTLKEVNVFCTELIKIVTHHNNSFVIFHCNEAYEYDSTYVMSNLLSHKAHTIVEVETLPSGWSADVSGHLTIKYPGMKFDNEHLYKMDLKPARYLFKLFDRGVKLFAPGTV